MLLDNRVNRQRYDVLILPGGKVFSAEALGRVREFYERGGRVIATSCLPERSAEFGMDDALRSEVEALFGSPSERRAGTIRRNGAGGAAVFVPEPDARSLERAFAALEADPDVVIADTARHAGSGTSFGYLTKMVASEQEASASDPTGGNGASFLLYPQAERRRDIYFFTNSSNDSISTPVSLRGRLKLQRWDPFTGETTGLASRRERRSGGTLYAFRARSASRVGRFRRGRAPRIRSGIRPCRDSRAGVGTENRPGAGPDADDPADGRRYGRACSGIAGGPFRISDYLTPCGT